MSELDKIIPNIPGLDEKEILSDNDLFIISDSEDVLNPGINKKVKKSNIKFPNVYNITYAQLETLIGNSTLEKGKFYRITDFQTKYQIPNTSIIDTGINEPLIVLSISENSLSKICYSELHPEDIIWYDINNNSCEDGTWNESLKRFTGGTSRNGKIVYREDTILHLSCFYDWRNIKFRRWKLSASNYVGGNNYQINDICTSLVETNKIYIATKIVTGATVDPNIDTTNFKLWLDLSQFETDKISWLSVSANLMTLLNVNSGLIIDSLTYQDYYTFTLTEELTNSSGKISQMTGIVGMGYNNFSLKQTTSEQYPYNNIVFQLKQNSSRELYCRNNTFDLNCFDCTINVDTWYNNIFSQNVNSNFIGKNVYQNLIYSGFSKKFIYQYSNKGFVNDISIIKSVNGIQPDSDGNVTLPNALPKTEIYTITNDATTEVILTNEDISLTSQIINININGIEYFKDSEWTYSQSTKTITFISSLPYQAGKPNKVRITYI